MPIHAISYSDFGLYAYNGGSTPIGFRHLYVCAAGDLLGGGVYSWIELSQVWRCTSANPGTGVYAWQQFISTDKYAPKAVPQSVSATAGAYGGRPSTVNWVEDTTHSPGGTSYALQIVPHNVSQGTQATTINLPSGRSGTSYTFATPSGWNTGDDVYFTLFYVDGSGYVGPAVDTGYILIP